MEALDVRREQLAQVLLDRARARVKVRARERLRVRVRVRVRVRARVRVRDRARVRVRVRPRVRVRVGVVVLLEGREVRVELAAQRLVDRVGAEADVGRRRLEAGQG